jgi:2-methylisocitrate lyase-like PEP mutase family enzyme
MEGKKMNNGPKGLRELLSTDGLVWGPGIYDGISARIAMEFNFPILYMTGAGTSASRIGMADLGLTTASEMVENAKSLVQILDRPLVADADNGYGGVLNVARTVHQYETSGVAAIHIEDQVSPKRCGHLDGKRVVTREDFKARISAAVGERWNSDFVIIARTDARAVHGFEEAYSRIQDAFDSGADIGFLEAPQSMAEVEMIAKRCSGPMLLNMATGGRTPTLDVATVRDLGFKMAIWPAVCMVPAAVGIRHALEVLSAQGTDSEVVKAAPRQFFEWMGLRDLEKVEERYSKEV